MSGPRPFPPSPVVRRYGAHRDQVIGCWPSAGPSPRPVAVLLHGGFWRDRYAADLMDPMAADLAGRGVTVWNVEYRRVGSGGGWPSTPADVASALEALVTAAGADGLDLRRVALVGHSAGGHLALWAAARRRPALPAHGPQADEETATPRGPGRPQASGREVTKGLRPALVVGLAAVSDLAAAQGSRLGGGAVDGLLADPAAVRGARVARLRRVLRGVRRTDGSGVRVARRAALDPTALLPLGVPTLLVHGDADDAVPVAQSRAFAQRARAAGDACELVVVPGEGHMPLIDPASSAWADTAEILVERLRASSARGGGAPAGAA